MTPFTLYHLETCPFCIRVRRAADRLGLELELVEITEHPEAREMLIRERGRGTVPVLGIPSESGEETLVGESADIIAFLTRYASAAREVA